MKQMQWIGSENLARNFEDAFALIDEFIAVRYYSSACKTTTISIYGQC
jgi:hypothetical protein